MNPYDFVRIDWNKEVKRRPATPHDRFANNGLSGRIEGAITTLTPFFIPHSEDLRRKDTLFSSKPPKPITFIRNASEQHIIPGSSLKGLFRSLVETVGPGCWWLYDGKYKSKDMGKTIYSDYKDKLPYQFKQCPQQEKLCIACRLFGLVNGDTLRSGQVSFDDAVCVEPIDHPEFYTPVLDMPKARHEAWYLGTNKQQVAGRKFYFHFFPEVGKVSHLIPIRSGGFRNSYIKPLGINSCFTFSMHFNNIAPADWPTLLYALTLERKDWGHNHDIRHKLGYAKPVGLGSVEVLLTKLTLINYRERYTTAHKGITNYEGNALQDYVNEEIRPKFLDANTTTLQDLRRIWGWPPDDSVTYCYPSKTKWFDLPENKDAPISATKDAPCQ